MRSWKGATRVENMATRSNINPCESAKKRRKLSGGGCFFQLSWVNDFHYIRASIETRNKAYCMACDVHFDIGHGGKNDVQRRIARDCHRAKASALSHMCRGIARYVATGTEVDRVTAESMFANFIAKSNLPLARTDDFGKIVGICFPTVTLSKSSRRGEPKPSRSSRERLLKISIGYVLYCYKK